VRKITSWIVSKVIKDHQKINDLKVRAQYGSLEGWVSIVINVILFGVKITAGLMINSVSLIADAVHTLADSVTSVVVIVGFKMAGKPSDKEHPFGHGRMESVATLIVAVLLFVAGVELIEKSVHSIFTPHTATAPVWVILIIAFTILIKELLARFSFILGDMIDSKALKADALHHRSDVIATALVVVALIASRFGFDRIDGIMGVFVSLIIFYSAYEIGKDAIDPLLGEAVSKDTLKEIEKIARKREAVFGVHDIIFHKYGQTSIISLHIEVSDKDDVTKLHSLSEEIEEEISLAMGGVVVVHIDPINKDHPKYEMISKTLNDIISEDPRVNSFHE
jgi:cation diffusion facilitator family transporter